MNFLRHKIGFIAMCLAIFSFFDVVHAQLPDLTVTSVTWNGIPTTGEPLSITFVATNIGTGSATGKWDDGFVLSSNTTLAGAIASYHYLATTNRTIPPNASYVFSNTWFSLPAVQPGNYYLLAVANDQSNVNEVTYTNNALAVPITLAVPDFAVTSLTWTGVPSAGQPLSLTFVVTNIGTGTVNAAWDDEFVLSTNTSIAGAVSGGTTHRFDYTRRVVPPNGSYTLNTSILLPDVAPGNYYLIAVANDGGSVYETNYSNNSIVLPITVGIADLSPISLTWTASATAGQSYPVSYVVTNMGTGSVAGSWYDAFVFSTNTTVAGAVSNGLIQVPISSSSAIPPGDKYTVGTGITVPDVPPGNYYLLAVVDYQDTLYESNYSNNGIALPITIGVPDLSPTSVVWIGTPTAGNSLYVSMVATNIGTGIAVGQWEDGFVLSSNTTLAGALPGASYHFTPFISQSVPPGGSYSNGGYITLPSGATGTYYLVANANDKNALFESSYSNNVLAQAMTIGNTDLAATNMQIVGRAVVGSNITVSYQVQNADSNAYSGYWYDGLSLSTNNVYLDYVEVWGWYGYHSLAPGQSYTLSQTFAIPQIPPGTNYYLIAWADDWNLVMENNKSNNFIVTPITVTAPAVVTMTSPTNLTDRTSCIVKPFTLQAAVQTQSYTVTNVIFFDGNVSNVIGQATNAPWTATAVLGFGTHNIGAEAQDNSGLTGITSNLVNVTLHYPTNLNVLRTDIATNGDIVDCMCASNGNYLVQTTTNLSSPANWQPYATNQVSSNVLVFTNHPSGAGRYFRAKLVQ